MKREQDCFYSSKPCGDRPNDTRRPELNLLETSTDGKVDDQFIACGYVPVVLAKMFGPLIFADLRIRADVNTCEWIVERENIKSTEEGDSMEWVEVARIQGQTDEDFSQ